LSQLTGWHGNQLNLSALSKFTTNTRKLSENSATSIKCSSLLSEEVCFSTCQNAMNMVCFYLADEKVVMGSSLPKAKSVCFLGKLEFFE